MIFLGPNLMPLATNQILAAGLNVNARQDSMVYFFEGPMRETVEDLLVDHNLFIERSAAAMYLPMQALKAGYVPVLEEAACVKPVHGSIFMPTLNAVVHYPSAFRVLAKTASITSVTENSATPAAKNSTLSGTVNLPYKFPGLPIKEKKTTLAYNMELTYADEIRPDGIMSHNWGNAISGTVGFFNMVGTTPTLASEAFSIPEGLRTYKMTNKPQLGTKFRLTHAATDRTASLVTAGGSAVDNKIKTAILTHAVFLSRNSAGLVQHFVCDIGGEGSGAYIQLESVVLTTGQSPEIIKTLTGTGA